MGQQLALIAQSTWARAPGMTSKRRCKPLNGFSSRSANSAGLISNGWQPARGGPDGGTEAASSAK